GRPNMRNANELAKRGLVVLEPDHPAYGPNQYDFKTNAGHYASGAIKAVWDNIRGVDLLETIPEVGSRRISIMGHGLGGRNALLTAAFDFRIASVASSAGFTSFAKL